MQVEGGGEGGLETLVYQKQCINSKATVSLTKFQKCITGRYVHLRYLLITILPISADLKKNLHRLTNIISV